MIDRLLISEEVTNLPRVTEMVTEEAASHGLLFRDPKGQVRGYTFQVVPVSRNTEFANKNGNL